VPPGLNPTWLHVEFSNNSRAIDTTGQRTVAGATTYRQQNPAVASTIIGKTDTAGSLDDSCICRTGIARLV
jgi:hypothetical protein